MGSGSASANRSGLTARAVVVGVAFSRRCLGIRARPGHEVLGIADGSVVPRARSPLLARLRSVEAARDMVSTRVNDILRVAVIAIVAIELLGGVTWWRQAQHA